MTVRRLVIGLGGFVALILLILVFGALLIPRLIDGQLVRQKISSIMAEKTRGTVTLAKIDLLWFPQPTVVIENAEISIDENIRGTIRTIRVYPSILYLLTGSVVLRRARFEGPQVKIRLSEQAQGAFEIEELENNIRSALIYLTTEPPGLRLDLSDGSAEIEIGTKPPIILENVDARSVASSSGLSFRLNARSNFWKQLRVNGEIKHENLAAQLKVAIERFKLQQAIASLAPQFGENLRESEPSFNFEITAGGLKKIKAAIAGSIGPLVLGRRGEKVNIEAKGLKGNLVYEEGDIHANVERLDLASPRLSASAELTSTPTLSSARIQIRDVDIAEIRQPALQIAGDLATVKTLFQLLQAGSATELDLQSHGPSFAEMGTIKNLIISGSIRNGKIFVPWRDLELNNVSASMRVSDGLLTAREIAASLGTVKGWDGNLKLGLEGENAPFHLEMAVEASATELRDRLLKVIEDETLRRELLKVRDVTGELSGRLVLGERLDAISPIVSISKTDVIARYDPIPFPVGIKSGQFIYDRNTIGLENVQGSVGSSTIARLNATLPIDGSRRLKIDAGRISLDLDQTHDFLQSFTNVRSRLEKLQAARGRLDLENLTFTGAYDDPAGWKFTTAGMIKQVEITHADLPGSITFTRGNFAATQATIKFSDAVATIRDASLNIGGFYEGVKGDSFKLEVSGSGTIGEQMTKWLSRRIELPQELMLRSPLKIIAGQIAWQFGVDVSFRGKAIVAGGPQITLDAERHAQNITVRDVTVEDGAQRARMTLKFAQDSLDLSFDGTLGQQTLNRVFASLPSQPGSLQGKIDVKASRKKPWRFSVRGQLAGSNFWVPWKQENALVEKFRIEGAGTSVLIQSAALRWRNSRITIAGKVAEVKEVLRVDVDVSADRLKWEELNRSFGQDDGQKNKKGNGILSHPPVEGTIRLKADSFIFERFNLSPLQMTATISPSGVRANIDQGVACGIKATGRVDVTGKEIDLDVHLAATEAQLGSTSVCLTDRENDVKGIYSLKAHVLGRAQQEHLLQSLKGDFELTARDGAFVRAPPVDATFDYLNATGDFKIAFPDLDKEMFRYSLLNAKGSIDGETLVADEIIVESPLLNLSGQGKIDLARKQINGKGLIAVLKPVNDVISRIPLIGSLFGGSFLGIPVRVTGSLERPEVTYLSPKDVGTELLHLPMRILGLPLEAIKLFTPTGKTDDK
jgi:AsmA-like C-terminal region